MSLGFNSYEGDAPAWGNNAVFPYKELWVYSSCRIAHNLARIGVPGRVGGSAPQGASFRSLRTGAVTQVQRGRYGLTLPPGDYDVAFGGVTRRISLGNAAARKLRLDPDATLDMRIQVGSVAGSMVTLKVRLAGAGLHTLQARTFNCRATGLPARVTLRPGEKKELMLELAVAVPETKWVVVLVPDGNLSDCAEASGKLVEVRSL